jgi:hypothetical protein
MHIPCGVAPCVVWLKQQVLVLRLQLDPQSTIVGLSTAPSEMLMPPPPSLMVEDPEVEPDPELDPDADPEWFPELAPEADPELEPECAPEPLPLVDPPLLLPEPPSVPPVPSSPGKPEWVLLHAADEATARATNASASDGKPKDPGHEIIERRCMKSPPQGAEAKDGIAATALLERIGLVTRR